ncbi:MAG: glutamine--fructose-6-phosphate transaminase (isomerizing) [Pseudomonadota bacterium]|nr:glutamine--fructose-6-phosphate transaminase (isomerizing) [Pseudomonadota bacterium]
MCGIVGAIGERQVAEILLEGLHRLEYRGYDSAGMAVLEPSTHQLGRHRRQGKVAVLQAALEEQPLAGNVGIAHTRWATHGVPNETNAHPHISSGDLAVVHNGIVENYVPLRAEMEAAGYQFYSDTDTEVIAHLVHHHYTRVGDLHRAVFNAVQRLTGAFALGVIHRSHPDQIVAARQGSPLVIGIGIGENFIASDPLALRQVTDRFLYLEEGDVAMVRHRGVLIWDRDGVEALRALVQLDQAVEVSDRGKYRHYMLKEIYEQPAVVQATFEGRVSSDRVLEQALGPEAEALLSAAKAVQIVACGTSYHAGYIAKYWIEALAGLPCRIEVASEFRYRAQAVPQDTLFLTISQSGETADTLAALRMAKDLPYLGTLAICNVPASSLVRESDLVMMTCAGPEIGVASTKAFTTQLVGLFLVTLALARHQTLNKEQERTAVEALHALPSQIQQVLDQDHAIARMAEQFAEKHHALFLGRGALYPVAMEGALKLKEISYIHAEAYPAGELKHGPLALVDADMPVITVAPNNELLEKLRSNLQEVRARGGELYVFAEEEVTGFDDSHLVALPRVNDLLAPVVYTVPLQLLAYHVAVLKGTDVDQPRNLAKSVTVE